MQIQAYCHVSKLPHCPNPYLVYTTTTLHGEAFAAGPAGEDAREKGETNKKTGEAAPHRYFYGRRTASKYRRGIDETTANPQPLHKQSGNPLGQMSMNDLRKRGRECAYCGKPVSNNTTRCPHCREVLPQVRVSSPVASRGGKRNQILRGFLYMMLAVVVHYVLGRSDSFNLPFTVPAIALYLTPILFLGGLGLALYGFMNRVTT